MVNKTTAPLYVHVICDAETEGPRRVISAPLFHYLPSTVRTAILKSFHGMESSAVADIAATAAADSSPGAQGSKHSGATRNSSGGKKRKASKAAGGSGSAPAAAAAATTTSISDKLEMSLEQLSAKKRKGGH